MNTQALLVITISNAWWTTVCNPPEKCGKSALPTLQAEAAEAQLEQVQAELSDTYKSKSALADELLKARSRSLQPPSVSNLAISSSLSYLCAPGAEKVQLVD